MHMLQQIMLLIHITCSMVCALPLKSSRQTGGLAATARHMLWICSKYCAHTNSTKLLVL